MINPSCVVYLENNHAEFILSTNDTSAKILPK